MTKSLDKRGMVVLGERSTAETMTLDYSDIIVGTTAECELLSAPVGGQQADGVLTCVVVLTALPDTESYLTHAFAEIASQYIGWTEYEPHRTIWFRHLPAFASGPESYDLVLMDWEKVEGSWVASKPSYHPVRRYVVEGLMNRDLKGGSA